MAAPVVAGLGIGIGVDTQAMAQGYAEANQLTQTFVKQQEKSFASLAGRISSLAGVGFGGFLNSSLQLAKTLAQSAVEMRKFADAAGEGLRGTQNLQQAMTRLGVSSHGAMLALGAYSNAMSAGGEQADKYRAALGKLGISLNEIRDLSPAERAQRVLSDPGFGGLSSSDAQALAGGEAGAAAQATGASDLARAWKEANDAIKLSLTAADNAKTFLNELAAGVRPLANVLTEGIFGKTNLDNLSGFFSALATGLSTLVTPLERILGGLSRLDGEQLDSVAAALAAWVRVQAQDLGINLDQASLEGEALARARILRRQPGEGDASFQARQQQAQLGGFRGFLATLEEATRDNWVGQFVQDVNTLDRMLLQATGKITTGTATLVEKAAVSLLGLADEVADVQADRLEAEKAALEQEKKLQAEEIALRMKRIEEESQERLDAHTKMQREESARINEERRRQHEQLTDVIGREIRTREIAIQNMAGGRTISAVPEGAPGPGEYSSSLLLGGANVRAGSATPQTALRSAGLPEGVREGAPLVESELTRSFNEDRARFKQWADNVTDSLSNNLSRALATGNFKDFGSAVVGALQASLAEAGVKSLKTVFGKLFEGIFGGIGGGGGGGFLGGIFGGLFHQGGIVPGGPRQERLVLARGGEGIFTPNQLKALQQGRGGANRNLNFNMTVQAYGSLDGSVMEAFNRRKQQYTREFMYEARRQGLTR